MVNNHRVILDPKFALSMDVSQRAILVPLRHVTPKQAWTDPYPVAVKYFDAFLANPERLSFPLDGLLLVGYRRNARGYLSRVTSKCFTRGASSSRKRWSSG